MFCGAYVGDISPREPLLQTIEMFYVVVGRSIMASIIVSMINELMESRAKNLRQAAKKVLGKISSDRSDQL